MVSDPQRVIAVWAVLVIPFVLLVAFLWSRDEVTLKFFVAYWFPPLVLTLIGAIPPPWQIVG